MPKILINEVDQTFAGNPDRYGNYSVLLTGYMGTPDPSKGEVQSPDANGVYEFNSKGDFLATIGSAKTEKKDGDVVVEYHYGNRMAEHLLNLGYTIIYKVISRVSEMDSETFWEDFKDKASYDFRFISHGLLETCYDIEEHTELYDRLVELEADAAKFVELMTRAENTEGFDELTEVNKLTKYQGVFETIITPVTEGGEGYTGFLDDQGIQYGNYSAAMNYLKADAEGKVPAIETHKALIATHEDGRSVTPTVFNNINGYIADLANYVNDDKSLNAGRGDCIALIELNEDSYCEKDPAKRPEELIIEGIKSVSAAIADAGKYCAMTVPSVYYKLNDVPVKLPGAFHYLACFMNSLRSGFAEWYAAAGYTRGVSSYVIDHTSVKLGEIAINTLEPRSLEANGPNFACNVIANFRGSYYLWGNRTAAALITEKDLTADHFLNIRQLCTTIKKQLYVACRRFTFDPNSDTLWINFVNAITPTLDAMKADQGISDYRIVKAPAGKKATLKAVIRIIPIEAVEDFDITVYLEDSFGGTSVTAEG